MATKVSAKNDQSVAGLKVWQWPSIHAALLVVLAASVAYWAGPDAMSELTLMGLYIVTVIGLNLFMGYAGQVSLGQAGFFGLGAYAFGIWTTRTIWPVWGGVVLGMLVAAAVAWILSLFILRLKTHYLALATLAFGMMADVAFQALPLTGGNSGLTNIGSFTWMGHAFSNADYFGLSWIGVGIAAWLASRVVHSGGRVLLETVRSSEIAATLLGIDPIRVKREMFIVSAIMAAFAGAVYASWIGYIDPTVFTFTLSVNFVLMAVVGGMRSVYGAAVGVVLVEGLGQGLKTLGQAISPTLGGALELAVYGVILVIVMMYWPDGVVSAWKDRRRRRVRDAHRPSASSAS